MSQINAELGWGFNLDIYRGKTFYRGNNPVVISNSPSFAEFYGLAPSPGTTPLQITGFSPTSPHQVFRPTPGVLSSTQTVQTTGGVAPLSYAWSVVSNNAGGGFSTATNGPTCGFNTASQTGGFVGTTVLRCTVTDANSVVVSADFTLNWEVII
jgi:hypothetical protein